MSLILGKDGIRKLMVGYPTTAAADNDVMPATLESGTAYNGSVMKVGSAHSLYVVASSVSAAKDIAGVLLATNVKVPDTYPAASESVATRAGEQFNLLVHGFVAVVLDASAVLADAVEGATVYITSGGALTTVSTSNIALPWRFTGVTELHGTTKVAEVIVRA